MGFDRGQSNWQEQLISLADLARPNHISVAAQNAAATLELPVHICPHSSAGTDLRRLAVVFSGAIAGGASANTATLQFRRYTSAGVLVGNLGNAYVSTTAATAFAEVPMYTQSVTLSAGDIITIRLTSAGTGQALPAFLAVAETSPRALGGQGNV